MYLEARLFQAQLTEDTLGNKIYLPSHARTKLWILKFRSNYFKQNTKLYIVNILVNYLHYMSGTSINGKEHSFFNFKSYLIVY